MTKRAPRERVIQIRRAIDEGKSTAEIAALLSISPRRVRQIAYDYAIDGIAPNTRRFSFHCARKRAAIVAALADEAGVSPSTMIERIVALVVDDGEAKARARLRKIARAVSRRDQALR